MSIDDAKPSEWDRLVERYYDNREFPKDVQPECILPADHHEMMKRDRDRRDSDRYAPSPDVKPYDSVENPMHYEGVIECIDYIEDRLSRDELIGYYYGSVLKYAHRWKQKGGVESLRKCRWFLNRLITTEATGG